MTYFRVKFTNVNKYVMFLPPAPSLSFLNRIESSWCAPADGWSGAHLWMIWSCILLADWWLVGGWIPKAQQWTKPAMILAFMRFRVGEQGMTGKKETQIGVAEKEHRTYSRMKNRLGCQDHLLSGHPGGPWGCKCLCLCSHGELSTIYPPMKAQAKTKC